MLIAADVHITDIVDPTLPPVDVTLTGEATVSFTRSGTDASPFFDTEMLSMDLTGGGSTDVRIRESPTRPSTGRHLLYPISRFVRECRLQHQR